MMHYVDVQGARIPKLGMGTWQLHGRACRDAVVAALQIGYRHIDTAQMYENEAEVGQAIQMSTVPRDDLWITTKLALDNCDEKSVVRSTRESLKRLATEHVDLLLIHWPSETVPVEETLGAMMRLRDEGLVRHIGVSNFTRSQLEAATRSAPLLGIQVEYHPFLPQDPLLSIAQERELLFTAYSPLARGEVMEDETLQSIAQAHDKSPGQVALRWLVQQRNVAAIPKASSEAHLRENFAVFDFELSRDEMSRIDRLREHRERLIDPDFAPAWENP